MGQKKNITLNVSKKSVFEMRKASVVLFQGLNALLVKVEKAKNLSKK